MKSLRIAELLQSPATDAEVVVKGWVRTKRGNKNVAFIALNDGSCVANMQVVVDLAKFDEELLRKVTTGDWKSTRLNSSHASKSRMPSSA